MATLQDPSTGLAVAVQPSRVGSGYAGELWSDNRTAAERANEIAARSLVATATAVSGVLGCQLFLVPGFGINRLIVKAAGIEEQGNAAEILTINATQAQATGGTDVIPNYAQGASALANLGVQFETGAPLVTVGTLFPLRQSINIPALGRYEWRPTGGHMILPGTGLIFGTTSAATIGIWIEFYLE